ncbi:hypothetical protein [Acetivibrio cellulolyticus]|uniref:hypothetical protein n=1 Tax=Acetivibrio cellulolyticus TaxID=35830 RepID=UPI0001E2E725|nr:hypothetical protein [Acetivibrio cellulolyticus]
MKIQIVLLVFMIIISLSGCSKNNSERVQNVSAISGQNVAKENAIIKSSKEIYPLNQLKDCDIEWITKKGGIPSEKNWAALYPEKDEEKIVKIVNLVKSCSDIHKSTKDELDFLRTKHGYPVDIIIRMKDGSQFSLMSAMKLTARTSDNGTETTGTTCKDHFLLKYEKSNLEEYYTIYSNDATAYILEPSNPDFPRVDNFVITPKDFNYGDKISISGGGCTEKEVIITLSNGNDAEKEEYVIGKVKPVYGEWHWDGIISKNTKTYDGRDIQFKNKNYYIGIQMGESGTQSGIPIAFTQSDTASEDSNVWKAIGPEVVENLKSIEIINMNSESKSKVNLKLPEDFYATEYIYDVVPEFQLNEEKSKQIKKSYSFNLYNRKDTNKFNLYGIKGVAGRFEMTGSCEEQPNKACFPNHSCVKAKVFSGRTVLGQGEIFILDCDLRRELRTEKNTTYDVIYAWVPIKNENSAYNLAICVPVGEKNDAYIQIVKNILEAE